MRDSHGASDAPWERRHLFAGTWSCVGRVDELPAQHGVTVGDVPVLLIRDVTERPRSPTPAGTGGTSWCPTVGPRGPARPRLPHFRPGPFAPNEDAVQRWVTLIRRAYGGAPPWECP